MPPFPERESSILAKLKKKRPDKVSALLEPKAPSRAVATENNKTDQTVVSSVPAPVQNHVSSQSSLALVSIVRHINEVTLC